MDLTEIINRPDETPLQEQECYFILSEYVRARKGVAIVPRIETRFGQMIAERDAAIMHEMLNYAIAWFRINQKS